MNSMHHKVPTNSKRSPVKRRRLFAARGRPPGSPNRVKIPTVATGTSTGPALVGAIAEAINGNNPAAFAKLTSSPAAKLATYVLDNPEIIEQGKQGAALLGKLLFGGSNFVPDPDGTPTNVETSVGWSKMAGDPTGSNSLVTPKKFRVRINRMKSRVLKAVSKLHTPTKVYTYKSQMADKYRYHAGGNVKGVIVPFFEGPTQWASTPASVLSSLTFTGSPTAPFSTGDQDYVYPFCWSSRDDQSLVKSLIAGSATALYDQASSTDGVAGFPVQSKHISFSIYNSNRFLSAEITIMTVRHRLPGATSPAGSWINLPTVTQDVNKMSREYTKYAEVLTTPPDGCTSTPYGEVSVALEASPGLSNTFTRDWLIIGAKKITLAAGGSVDVQLDDEMAYPMMTTDITTNANFIYPEGVHGFLMTFKGKEPVVCVKNSAAQNNASYDFVLRTAPIRLRVTNIRKWAVCSANSNQTNTGNTLWTSSMNNLIAPRQFVVDNTLTTFAYQSQYGQTVGLPDSRFVIPLLTDKSVTTAGPMVSST